MSGINVRTLPDMEVENFDDATEWTVNDQGILTLLRNSKRLAQFNSMGWVSVWLEETTT